MQRRSFKCFFGQGSLSRSERSQRSAASRLVPLPLSLDLRVSTDDARVAPSVGAPHKLGAPLSSSAITRPRYGT